VIKLPEWLIPDLWAEFEKHRKKLRKPMTDYARRLIVSKLESIYREFGDDPNNVLAQSIMEGWQGVFPLRETGRSLRDAEMRRELNAGRGPRAN
jgi:hypothetical protein